MGGRSRHATIDRKPGPLGKRRARPHPDAHHHKVGRLPIPTLEHHLGLVDQLAVSSR